MLDLLMRIENGLNNCAAATFDSAVVRDSDIGPEAAAVYRAAIRQSCWPPRKRASYP